jgi:hypothetical protein
MRPATRWCASIRPTCQWQRALQRTGRDPTRASLLRTLEHLSADVGGMAIAYSAKEHQGTNRVFLTVVKDGKAVPVAK